MCSESTISVVVTATAALSNAAFGEGTGRIWMSGLSCGTTELSLFSCSSVTAIGSVESTTSCSHSDDVAVRCQGLATGNDFVNLPLSFIDNTSLTILDRMHIGRAR